jgi:hypothetical protein
MEKIFFVIFYFKFTKIKIKEIPFREDFPCHSFNVETLQAFGAVFQIPQYYRKFLYYKTKMLCNYVINIKFLLKKKIKFDTRMIYFHRHQFILSLHENSLKCFLAV